MTTYRIKHDNKYFSVSNALFNDKRLSWEARGLMGYLLSKPDNWQVRVFDMVNQGPAKREKIQRILAELESFGYLRRELVRLKGGRFDWVSTISETPDLAPSAENQHPLPLEEPQKCGSTVDGKTVHGSAVHGEPPHIVSTESPSTESQSTEKKEHTTANASENSSLQEKEREENSKLVGEVKKAFAWYDERLRDVPERGEARYPKWQKDYKALAEVCTRKHATPGELAQFAVGEAQRMHTLITSPGSYAKIAEGYVPPVQTFRDLNNYYVPEEEHGVPCPPELRKEFEERLSARAE